MTKYHGNKTGLDKRSNEHGGWTARKHKAFDNTVGRQRHKTGSSDTRGSHQETT